MTGQVVVAIVLTVLHVVAVFLGIAAIGKPRVPLTAQTVNISIVINAAMLAAIWWLAVR